MAYEYDPKANPYASGRKPSRDALDRYFGKPAIDARAPQSPLDTTPSGRMTRIKQGENPQAEKDMADAAWAARFPNTQRQSKADFKAQDMTAPLPEAPPALAPDTTVKPADLMRQRTPPQSPLEAIRSANEGGAPTGAFSTPYGAIGFDRRPLMGPKLMPDSPLAISGLDSYLSTLSGGTAASAPIFQSYAKKRPSILDGADKWTQPL